MFRVRWKKVALDDLALIWLNADSPRRRLMTQAANVIDQLLRNDPDNQGESRPKGKRILFVPPLGILFKVDTQGLVVRVTHVWAF